MASFYPLRPGNNWTYRNNTGSTFSNAVVTEENGVFTMTNTLSPVPTHVKREGDTLYTDSYEAGNYQPFLKEDAAAGDHWEIHYKANGVDSILSVVVKSVGEPVNVEGKSYADVMQLEGMMSFVVNGSKINAGTRYQWYYARGTGLVLTTSSLGDNMPLVSCEIK